MKKRSPTQRKDDPARYALAPGTCDVIADLCKTGLTFDEALVELLSRRPHLQEHGGTTDLPEPARSPPATGKGGATVDPDV